MTAKLLFKRQPPTIKLLVLLYTPLCHTVTLLTKKRDAVPISYYYLIGTASHGT